jgi:peptidyl-prolyl cis-trans isomerase D
MFDFVRTHTRLLQFLLALLVFPSFILFGIQGYSRFSEGANNSVAKVAGQPVTRAEWDTAYQRQLEMARRRQPNLDVKAFDTPELRMQILDGLVRDRVLETAVQKMHLTVSGEQLARHLQSMPELQQLRGADGQIDRAKYKALLQAQGWTADAFEARLSQELALQQVLAGIEGGSLSPKGNAKAALEPLLQQREVQLQRFDAKDYLTKVSPADADIAAYYKANEAQFKAPEQASIEYVVLDVESLKRGVAVSEEEVRKVYDTDKTQFSTPEERRASHILIKADKDTSAADRAKAKAKAESLLAEVKKNPAAFADLAKKNSDDPGSKDQGGDLGFFAREAMTKPFSDAAFSMKPGEVSGVVETEFGYHIIKLAEVRGGGKKPFEAVKASIEDDLKKQAALRRYTELASEFSNMVYEQSDSLQPVIDKLKLEKRTATLQHMTAAQGEGPLGSQKFVDAVFSADALRNKRNTDAVEIAPNQLAAAHVVQYTPARTLPLAEVKDRVRERVVAAQATAQARKEGEARLAQLKQGGDVAGLAQPVLISRVKPEGLPRQIVDAALRADASKLPAAVGVDLGDQGYAVVRVNKVQAPDSAGQEFKALESRYEQSWGNAEAQAYYNALKARYKAEVKPNAKVEAAEAAASAAAR